MCKALEDMKTESFEKGIEQGIEKGIEQGIEKGIEQGMERGIEKGREEGIEQVALNLLKQDNITKEQIILVTGLSLKRISELEQMI